jgi:Ulp1 family protease
VRQFNGHDCGAFVTADILSLAERQVPSTLQQNDMGRWRLEMLEMLRSLEVRAGGGLVG